MGSSLKARMRSKWVIILVVAVLAVAGLTAYSLSTQLACGLVCRPIPYPKIQTAHAQVDSQGETNCQTTPSIAVCPVFFNEGGESGNVTLNVIDQDQQSWQSSSTAQFLVYSSNTRFISFKSLPTCAYTSAPNFTSPSCPVGLQTQTFQFYFTVSPSYVPLPSSVARQPESITVVIYKSCCWP